MPQSPTLLSFPLCLPQMFVIVFCIIQPSHVHGFHEDQHLLKVTIWLHCNKQGCLVGKLLLHIVLRQVNLSLYGVRMSSWQGVGKECSLTSYPCLSLKMLSVLILIFHHEEIFPLLYPCGSHGFFYQHKKIVKFTLF